MLTRFAMHFGEAGAGSIGEYSFCSFSVTGKGRFMPNENANPHIDGANKLEVNIQAHNLGTKSTEVKISLQQIISAVAHKVQSDEIDFGILVCGLA
ncbi:MAG TPA: hypothetical protein VLG16_03360 [Candidatus Saccharimonadales bacterium]|nr:hypothetical protein [Candidatus Saccharimonadales bacterium]